MSVCGSNVCRIWSSTKCAETMINWYRWILMVPFLQRGIQNAAVVHRNMSSNSTSPNCQNFSVNSKGTMQWEQKPEANRWSNVHLRITPQDLFSHEQPLRVRMAKMLVIPDDTYVLLPMCFSQWHCVSFAFAWFTDSWSARIAPSYKEHILL